MITRWVCKGCNEKWIYPISECLFCGRKIEKEIGKKTKVIGFTKVAISSPEHPIVPYYTLILEDEHGNRMPKKVMKEYQIGDEFVWEPSSDKNAVSIVKIKYDYYEAVKKAIELIGDIEVTSKDKILIKPNIMTAAYPYLALTTNPKVVKGLVEYLIQKGADPKNITLAEHVQFGNPEKAFAKSDFKRLSQELGIGLVDISDKEFIEKMSGEFKFNVSKMIFDYDMIINVPVMKTHMLLGISGALENMTRLISAENYKEFLAKPDKVLEAICHLHKILPKYLTIADCSIGLQGNGPLNYGEPAFLNMVLAGKDPVAIDKVFQEIGLLKTVPLTAMAERFSLGSADLKDIIVVGEDLDACRRELKPALGSKLIKAKDKIL